ncbi:MAG TPA: hypothetical protein VNL77_11560 [Roseiflexaceae bacterium]|nr:hypothetical protein [Roseiflexaceae bacterium]
MSEAFTHHIEVYTTSLVIAGAYDLPLYRRVSDAINGEQRRYIPLRAATIAPLARQQQPQSVPELLVDRAEALLVATLAEAAPPPDYPREEQIRGVAPVTAMFFTEAFVVRGTFYRRPNHSLIQALEWTTDDFLPLRHVQLYPLNGSFAPLTRDFAALARARIVALYQLADAPAPPPSAAPLPPINEPAPAASGSGDGAAR